MGNVFINKVKKTILDNLQDEKFNVGKLADEIGLGRSQILRKVKASTGKSVNQLIKEIRLSESVKLLQKEEFTASEIAYKVGFSSPQYFNKCFHDFYGFPPGEYQNQNFQNTIPTQTSRSRFLERYLKYISSIIAFIVLMFLGYQFLFNSMNENKEANIRKSSIVILPFLNLSENENQEYFSDGITDAITLELSKIDSLRVISRTSSMRFKEENMLSTDIAKELDVDYLLEGSVLHSRDSISVVVQLIKPFPEEKHIWQNSYNGKFENIIQLINIISNEIASEINAIVLPIEEIISVNNVDATAYNLYLKGRYIWNQHSDKSIANSIKFLKESIEIDSTFAPAYVTLAEAYITLNKFISNNKEKPINREKSRSAINMALALDSALGEAYISKGNILGKFDWNWAGMREMLEKGLKIDPNNAYGHLLLSDYYLLNSNFERAIEEALVAEKLDPLNPMTGRMVGRYFSMINNYEKSIKQYKKVLDIFPNNGSALSELGFVYFINGQKEEAKNCWIKLQEIRGNFEMVKGYKEDTMENVFRYWLVGALKGASEFCTYPVLIAQVYMLLNENQKALDYLEIAYNNHFESLPVMLFLPDFNNLHNEPRFKKLVNKTGVVMNYSLPINYTEDNFKD